MTDPSTAEVNPHPASAHQRIIAFTETTLKSTAARLSPTSDPQERNEDAFFLGTWKYLAEQRAREIENPSQGEKFLIAAARYQLAGINQLIEQADETQLRQIASGIEWATHNT